MDAPDDPKEARRRLEAHARQLSARCPVVTASLVEIGRKCGHFGCKCNRGEKHVSHYLTMKEGGKTRTVYVPKEMLEEVRQWVEECRRLREEMRQSTDMAIALLRSHGKAKKRKRRRGQSS
jgi:hypothetical protein